MKHEKQVIYETVNTYTTLNTFNSDTKNVWLVFHGMGYLSRYFIDYFSRMDPSENFIIAPQAPSKYYQGKDYKHVGASWLTKENTIVESQNVLQYVDAVFKAEMPKENCRFIIVGYSQGVSIATRWMAFRKTKCDHLILHSGGIPNELTEDDFAFLDNKTKVTYIFGNKDPYITLERKAEESQKAKRLFGENMQMVVFNGVHEVNVDFLLELAQN